MDADPLAVARAAHRQLQRLTFELPAALQRSAMQCTTLWSLDTFNQNHGMLLCFSDCNPSVAYIDNKIFPGYSGECTCLQTVIRPLFMCWNASRATLSVSVCTPTVWTPCCAAPLGLKSH